MSTIKWYKDGEFTEEIFSDKIIIVKFCFTHLTKFDDRFSNNGYRYVMGYMNNKTFDIIKDIKSMECIPVDKDIIDIIPISYYESIQIKLGYRYITNTYHVSVSEFCRWKYTDIINKNILKEEEIEFYREKL